MEEFKKRLQIEHMELREKLTKLNHFLVYSNEFDKLDTVEKELLRIQSSAMLTYSNCLKARIMVMEGGVDK